MVKVRSMTVTKTTEQERFIEVYRNQVCNISKTCRALNIDRMTFYRWLASFPEFKQQVEEAELSMIDFAESQLYKNIEAGMEKAIEFFLAARLPGKYGQKDEFGDTSVTVNLVEHIPQREQA
ncbi:MAG: hypothetical protein NTX88_00570 [Candidatus Atribacteria bacterium]|nr:hypothetical protein [Candidatus Atribacteria bacterium]